MSVRTNWIDAGFALLNGAPTFLTLADRAPRPHEVTITPAAGWKTSMTGLPEVPGVPHRYRAPDFDREVVTPQGELRAARPGSRYLVASGGGRIVVTMA